jgi:predicted alpha/beta-fold hydrolase
VSVSAFHPARWTIGGHRQTILGYLLRRRLRWPHASADLVVDAGEDVRLLVRASWQPGPREARPALLLVHGLGGHDGSAPVIAAGLHAWSRGWHVLRMNMRGCGDSEAVCARLYNAGLDGDLVAIARETARLVPRVAIAGVSLGAGLTLLAASRRGRELPPAVEAIVAVSPPLTLAACADAFDRPGNRLYAAGFLADLKDGYRRRQQRRPDLYAAGRERGVTSIRGYDDAVTAPYAGFDSAAQYYERSSAGPYVAAIERPTLLLAAEDDPLIPGESVSRWALPASGCVTREIYATGGHVGFVAPTRAGARFWAAERMMDFVEEKMGAPSLPVAGL